VWVPQTGTEETLFYNLQSWVDGAPFLYQLSIGQTVVITGWESVEVEDEDGCITTERDPEEEYSWIADAISPTVALASPGYLRFDWYFIGGPGPNTCTRIDVYQVQHLHFPLGQDIIDDCECCNAGI